MADNLNAKSPKSTEKNKITNAVNRTTSETMRLGEPEKSVNHPTSLCTSTTKERKKTPAFQITSVTVGPRISNDGGDDSADDLDESHTDDISDVIDNSRITDIENETPSYSEDTFSKEEVFFNASNASLGTAPVIPTSSQYGLAIVGPEGGSNPQNPVVTCSNNVVNSVEVNTTSVSDSGNGTINIVNSVKPNETDMRDVHTHTARNERFKVVKIESTEPFKRGRWMCMDYLDHSMVQQQSQQAIIVKASEQSDAHTGSVQYVGPDSGVVLMDGLGVDHPNDHQNMPSGPEHHQPPSMVQNISNLTASQSIPSGYSTSVSPGQTLQQMTMGMMQQSVQIGSDMTSHAQSMSQVPIVGMVQQQPPTMGQSLPPQQMQNLLQGYQQSGYYPSTQHLASQASSMPVQNQSLVTSTAQTLPLPGSMGMTAPQQHLMTQPHYQSQLPSQQFQQASQHLQQPSSGMPTGPQPVQLTQPIQVSQGLPNQQIQVQVSQPMQPQALQLQVSQPMQTQSVQASQSMQVPSQSVPVQSNSMQSQSMQIPPQLHLQNQSQPVQVSHHMQTQSQSVQIPQQMQNVQISGQSQSMSVPQIQSQSIQVSQPMQNQPQSMHGQSQPIQNQLQQMQTQTMQAQPLQQQQIQVQSQVSQQMHSQSQPVQMTQMQSQSQPVQVPQQVQPTSQSVQVPTPMQAQSQHVQHIQQVQVPQMQAQAQSMQVPQMQTQTQPVQVQHQMQAQSQPMPVTSQMQNQSQPVQMAPQIQHTQPVSVSQHMPVQLPVSQPMQSQPMGIQVQQVAQQPLQQLHVVGMPQPMMTPNSMPGMATTPMPPGYVAAPSGVGGGVVEMAMHPEPVQEPSVGMPQDKVVVGEVVQPGPAGDDNAGPAVNEEPESLAGLARRLALRACAVAPEREHCSGTAATSSTHCPPLSPHSPLHPPPPARTPVTASRAASPGDQPSASSTSAVAIDNKIEQAMDLVKSHLMFAVREEVEVLKERIAELMERINQLELENTILKQHASQETLAQLGSSKGTVAATQGPQQPTPQGQASLSLGQQAQPPASQVAPTSANNPTPMV